MTAAHTTTLRACLLRHNMSRRPHIVRRRTSRPCTLSVDSSSTSSSLAQSTFPQQLTFGFSAGGLLFPYLVGVTIALRRSGMLTEHSPFAGASAGSLAAALHHSGLSEDEVITATKHMYGDLREHGTRGRLRTVLEGSLNDMLPQDIHDRVDGKVFIALTQLEPELRPCLVSRFESREDFINALLTSCYVPLWFDKFSVANKYRGNYHMDGGLYQFIPTVPTSALQSLPAAGGAVGEGGGSGSIEPKHVLVSCFDTRLWPAFNEVDIAPGLFGDPLLSNVARVRHAFTPADDSMIDSLVAEGLHDGLAWAEQNIEQPAP